MTNSENINNIDRPTTILQVPIGPVEQRLFGRKIIYADYLPEDMNALTITKILNDVFSVHLKNSSEIDYLENTVAYEHSKPKTIESGSQYTNSRNIKGKTEQIQILRNKYYIENIKNIKKSKDG